MVTKRTNKIWGMSKQELETIIEDCDSTSEIFVKIGINPKQGVNFRAFKIKCQEENIDLTELKKRAKEKVSLVSKRRVIPLEEIMVKNSTYTTGNLKKRLIREGMLKEECADCGIGPEWNGKKLSLHLDHINGISNDHRFENLQILCPNCHSQTDTYSGKRNKIIKNCKGCRKIVTKHSTTGMCVTCNNEKMAINKRRVVRPGKEELLKELVTTNFLQTGKKYGVSDTAIRKWCRAYGLPTKPKELKRLWEKQKEEIPIKQ